MSHYLMKTKSSQSLKVKKMYRSSINYTGNKREVQERAK